MALLSNTGSMRRLTALSVYTGVAVRSDTAMIGEIALTARTQQNTGAEERGAWLVVPARLQPMRQGSTSSRLS